MSEKQAIAGQLPAWLSDYLQGAKPDAASEPFLQLLSGLTADDVQLRASEMMRLLRNSGFAEPDELPDWQLDPFPMLMDVDEWQQIEAGIKQRLTLIRDVTGDLIGAKQLVTAGLISSRQLMQHPYYLRERFTLPSTDDELFIGAFDVGKDTDGNLYLLHDHCQFPRGLGFILENRIVTRRVMSEEFSEIGVKRMADFVSRLQQEINDAATGNSDPRVVILGQDPEERYYSEQTFLASYLGYPLVRSADLTVRKGKVWLKALDGLKKVDVIVRWIEDRSFDSLEQTEFSPKGIPGLLHAIRKKHVTVVNSFGNSLVQIPAVKHKFNDIAQYLYGTSLLLQQPEIYASGDVEEAHLKQCLLRSWTDVELKLDGAKEPEKIKQLLQAKPDDLYLEQKIPLLKAPFWVKKRVQEKAVVMRFFAMHKGDEVTVLPSALCFSFSKSTDVEKVFAKDTWLKYIPELFEASEAPASPQISRQRRKATDMALVEGLISSRTAESLFWLGADLERGENGIRLIRLFIDLFTEQALYPDDKNLRIMERLREGILQQNLLYPYLSPDQEVTDCKSLTYKQVAQLGIHNMQIAGSLATTLNNLVGNAIQVRELLSYDSLRIVENLEDELRRIRKFSIATATHMMQSSLDRNISYLMAFNGSLLDSMSSSNGSFMLDIGRRIERITQLIAMLETLFCEELPEAEQMSLLDTILLAQVSSITHKRRYRMYQGIDTGLELLIFDAEYPRSLVYQLDQLITLCQKLPRKQAIGLYSNTEKILLRMKSDCIITDADSLCRVEHGMRTNLIALIHSVREQLKMFQEIMQTQYFSHTKTAKKLSWQYDGKSRESL
ncbi:MAG: circularly permuted type 2 ATP-grasp protein [Aestuariibacter sp.]